MVMKMSCCTTKACGVTKPGPITWPSSAKPSLTGWSTASRSRLAACASATTVQTSAQHQRQQAHRAGQDHGAGGVAERARGEIDDQVEEDRAAAEHLLDPQARGRRARAHLQGGDHDHRHFEHDHGGLDRRPSARRACDRPARPRAPARCRPPGSTGTRIGPAASSSHRPIRPSATRRARKAKREPFCSSSRRRNSQARAGAIEGQACHGRPWMFGRALYAIPARGVY